MPNQDKANIQRLEQELKEIKEKIRNDKPKDNSPPADKDQLQFPVCYYTELGRNHMWIDYDTKSDKIILIDKENSIFPNSELTKKGHNCIITFSVQDAEKYPNTHDHVYYFSKNNNKFTLKPEQKQPENSKTEAKVFFSTKAANERGEFTDYCFQRVKYEQLQKPFFLFYINENHPRIKELLSQGKLQRKKQFIIRYGKTDEEYQEMFACFFNENNQELEIIEV